MHLTLEVPTSNATHVLMEATRLWKNSSKFKFLFSNPQKYLVDVHDIDEDECPINVIIIFCICMFSVDISLNSIFICMFR